MYKIDETVLGQVVAYADEPIYVCAICGKSLAFIRDDVCKSCFDTWGKESEWVRELIKIEKHNRYTTKEGKEWGKELPLDAEIEEGQNDNQ
jgi:hypothetical protein